MSDNVDKGGGGGLEKEMCVNFINVSLSFVVRRVGVDFRLHFWSLSRPKMPRMRCDGGMGISWMVIGFGSSFLREVAQGLFS